MMKKLYNIILIALAVVGCDNFLDITPKGQVIPQTTDDFRKLLDKGYAKAPAGNSTMSYINRSFKSDISLRSDELILRDLPTVSISTELLDVFSWGEVTATFGSSLYPYREFYESIVYANEVITSGAQKMLDSDEKNQILGEAYALRAYNLFNLVNMYAPTYNKVTSNKDKGVPIVTKIDLEQVFPKASVAKVYEQILSDLTKAQELMNIAQQDKNKGLHYRFSKAALFAFMSRVYLYMGEYEKSVEATDQALSINANIVDLTKTLAISPIDENGEEMIMALDALYGLSLRQKVFVSEDMISKFDQINDLRFNLYVGKRETYYFIRKRGKSSFRVSELYLNKAEALAHIGNQEQSKKVLLSFTENRYDRNFHNLHKNYIDNLNKKDLIDAILEERARELIFEGHRWFDLRRANQKEIVHKYKDKEYTLQANDTRYTIPFPLQAIQENPLLND